MREDLIIHVLCNEWQEYELLDSGHCQKLERFDKYIVIRSEPKAWWKPELPEHEWKKAIAFHSGEEQTSWAFQTSIPHEWLLHFDNLTLQARFTATSKHIGVFPEKVAHWRWMRNTIKHANQRELRVLNLFAYTGVASLVAAAEGCFVTHVDSAKGVITWARENQRLSGLEQLPMRWIVDDAVKFVQREVRRQKRYDAIILDPPSFGRGPKGELWKIEYHLVDLLSSCRELLSDDPLFILITMYSIDQSSLFIGNILQDMMKGYGGTIKVGELALKPSHSDKKLSLSIFGQWEKESALP
jgi:23S rRNA (cytosine1962-C5)-methyltransferase